jgi:hypothetical protein
VTNELSREGYVAVVPALYHRLGSNPLFSYLGAHHGFHGDERPRLPG